jgi:hypothetical protein
MPRVGFGPTTPVFEREKTFRALDSAATVIGLNSISIEDKLIQINKYLAFFDLVGDRSILPELAS